MPIHRRVCAPGGRVVVVDTAADPAKGAEFNRLEQLRDPSHVRSLFLAELQGLYRNAGLGEPRLRSYELRDEVKNLLARSFPNPGDEEKIIGMFAAAIENDRLGIPVRRDGDRLLYVRLPGRDPGRPPAVNLPLPAYMGEQQGPVI